MARTNNWVNDREKGEGTLLRKKSQPPCRPGQQEGTLTDNLCSLQRLDTPLPMLIMLRAAHHGQGVAERLLVRGGHPSRGFLKTLQISRFWDSKSSASPVSSVQLVPVTSWSSCKLNFSISCSNSPENYHLYRGPGN